MREGRITMLRVLSCRPDQDTGSNPVIEVTTDHSDTRANAFYMKPTDRKGRPITIPGELDTDPTSLLECGQSIRYDVKDGLFNRKVQYHDREFRQSGYSFSTRDPNVFHIGPG